MLRMRRGCLLGCSVVLLAAVAASAESPAKKGSGGGSSDVAAIIGGKVITLSEVDARAMKMNSKLAQTLYDARRAAVDEMILEQSFASEASASGQTIEQLIKKRMAEKSVPVTDKDIETFYNANKARLRGRTLDQSKGQIKSYLAKQRTTSARKNLLAEAKRNTKVVVKLDPPRVEVVVSASEPAKGPASAKVTIVEYSDFQ